MVLGGVCQNCGKFSSALVSCRACGACVCHQCMDTKSGFCKLCGGVRKT